VGQTGIVDLTSGTVEIAQTDRRDLERFLGGRGLAAKLLYDVVPPEVGSGDAENAVILTSGPLNGTSWPAASRYHLTFRSPLTGCYGYANAGGKLGPCLAYADFDAIVVRGRAERPAYLLVQPDRVSIESAEQLWTRTTGETEAALHEEYPHGAIACIGPAGERGVLYASVMNDGGRAAARTGGGAVFGGKNLKAVVVDGGRPRRLPGPFLAESKRATERLLSSRALEGLREYGTPYLTTLKNVVGDLPARNHQSGQVANVDRVGAEAFERYKEQTKGCLGCPIRCGRISTVDHGSYACRTAGPEYETIDAFGPQCGCDDPEAIIYANMLCNELGLDTLSTGAAIAFAMECHEHGLLDEADLDLAWGARDTVIELVRRIAAREGIGNLLADGVRRAACTLGEGARRYAMEVKGLEIPSQEGRVAKAFGLGHVTSNRGADHLYGLPTIDAAGLDDVAGKWLAEAMPQVMDPDDESRKPDLLVLSEHYCAVADSLGVCKFSTVESWALDPDDLARALGALGVPIEACDLLKAGERIVNLERMYNVRLGLSAKNDTLPARFTEEPLPVRHGEYVVEHRIIDFEGMRSRYYALRGWDEHGVPTGTTLQDLALYDLVDGEV
jgi:aldehyde:ferredoxin oxidoreductase